MTKNFILNILINLLIVGAVYYGYKSYEAGNILVCGISIALLVVFIFFKRVLIKKVRIDLKKEEERRRLEKSKQ
jgi:phosphotransferase system  glucose/maltose/N-acetylglucosamine-specific IIC component